MSANQQEAFELVQGLAAELSAGEIRLPSLPKTVVRVRNALSKPDFSAAELARLVGAEPALAGAILSMANSITFRRAGRETTDLTVAISRIGAGMVQAAAMSFALRQLRAGAAFKQVEYLLAPEWRCSARVAAACFALARTSRRTNPEEAMIFGLIHNVGRIYLYSRAADYPTVFDSEDSLHELVRDWHAQVARAIVESWQLPTEAAEAIALQDSPADADSHFPMLDLLTLGRALETAEVPLSDADAEALAGRSDTRRLELGASSLQEIADALEETRQSLGVG